MFLRHCLISALGLTLGVAAAPPAPPGSYDLYVEGSAPRSSDLQSSVDVVKAELPGYNHMLRNQTSLAQKPQNDVDPPFGLQFEETCKRVALSGLGDVGETSLEAECMDDKGHWWDTSLNLNECMANDQGQLVYQVR